MLGVLLHQRDQLQGVYLGVFRKVDMPAGFAQCQGAHAAALGEKPQRTDAEQAFDRRGQQAETVDHLHLHLAQGGIACAGGDALVQDQAHIGVRQIVRGNQCLGVQVDLRDPLQRRIHVGQVAAAQRFDRAAQQLRVQAEPHAVDLPALLVAQKLPGAANFQVVGGQLIARAQISGRLDGLQSFARVAAQGRGRRAQQIRISLVMRTADAPAQLVQLGQTETIGAIDDDGVGVGDVDTRLDNRRAQQNMVALVIEVGHNALELRLGHLPVGDGDRQLRQQFAQRPRALVDTAHVIVHIKHLTAAQGLAQHRLFDQSAIALAHKGLDRQAPRGRGGDDR